MVDPAAQALCAAVKGAGHQVYFVGGCVRNALLGLPDSDVDMSTNALPEVVTKVAIDAGFKAIPTGIAHGTITVVVQGKPFEVTTFRRDVETDGRRAVVAFSDRIEDDARRRDFTMNALYATVDGQVIDPLGGLPDLLARRVRFIEDPAARITEDYLRTLRFFRFSAWYADTSDGFDPEALAAISANLDGLETLSAERVGQEIAKVLMALNPAPSVALMRQTGVLNTVLPGADDRWLAPLVHIEQALGLDPDWLCRLAALGGDDLVNRLRLSKADAQVLSIMREVGFSGPTPEEISYRHGKRIGVATVLLRSVMAHALPERHRLETVIKAAEAEFPVNAQDLMPELKGPALGQRLKYLEQLWIDSGFALSAQELLSAP
ncbi:PolyA polymerase family protein [Sulfitobacter noctilucae]|nr:PolyA polymerase family protein [Sulfitobacter noctilucae]